MRVLRYKLRRFFLLYSWCQVFFFLYRILLVDIIKIFCDYKILISISKHRFRAYYIRQDQITFLYGRIMFILLATLQLSLQAKCVIKHIYICATFFNNTFRLRYEGEQWQLCLEFSVTKYCYLIFGILDPCKFWSCHQGGIQILIYLLRCVSICEYNLHYCCLSLESRSIIGVYNRILYSNPNTLACFVPISVLLQSYS